MSKEVLIQFDHVSKKFCRSLKKSLWYGVQDIALELAGRESVRKLRSDEFWALKDISFEVRRGETLGLIGPNGAGKSTLLKLLTGIIKLDAGKIQVRGRVGALIELGTGFNPVLTGLENIYNNAAVLGIPKAEVDKKVDSIIEFAEIGDFIGAPVQSYSSGMKVRLGFAVAAHLEPDVMLIDEILAVGDVGFKAKCVEFIARLSKTTAVILVSHSMPMINRYCDRVLSLNHGELVSSGEPAVVIEEYYNLFEAEHGRTACLPGNELHEFLLMDARDEEIKEIEYAATLRAKICVRIASPVQEIVCKIVFLSQELQAVASCQSECYTVDNHKISLTVDMGALVLSPSKYKVSLFIRSGDLKYPLISYDAFWDLKVTGGFNDFNLTPVHLPGSWSLQTLA